MNTEIQRFDFKGAALRTLTDENGEPWFVAKDVCDVLELSNVSQTLARRLDDDEKSSITLNDGTPGNPNRAIVSESGLYVLVLASRKPEAHEFKRWVTHEVLPQIRRTGGYIPTTDADDDMTILAKAVMIGQRTMEARSDASPNSPSTSRSWSRRLKRLMISRTWKTGCLFAMRQRSCRTPEPPSRKNSCASGWPIITGFSNPVAFGGQPQRIALPVIS